MSPADPDPREVESQPDPGGAPGERVRDANAPARASSANAWAMACHLCGLLDFGVSYLLLGTLVPLGIWISQRGLDPYVDEQGREAVNFQLNLLFWSIVSGLLMCCCGLGLVTLAILAVVEVVLVVLAAIAAAEGRPWRYPWILRVIE
jgi:uncharacterized Tic20 family protein